MAPVSTIELKKQAIKAGMSRADARTADRAQLMDFLSDERKPVAKKKVSKKAPVKKQPVAKKKSVTRTTRKAVSKPAPRKPGRKPGRKPAPAKGNGNVGRAAIGKVDYTVESDAWQPRANSAVALIWKSLKRHRDNVDKVFSELRPLMISKGLVHKNKNDGTKRTKDEMEATLRYRINRTRFEYAVRTGQHESGTDRVKYGTGDYAQAKPKRKPARKPVATTRKPARKTTTTRKPKQVVRRKRVVRR